MTPRTVLVTGATGKVGRHLVAGLLEGNAEVRALVRRPFTAGLPAEVRIVEGDLQRPETVAAAAEGADAVFLLWPGFPAQGAAAGVDALARRDPHVVYLSAARLQGVDGGPMAGVWADVERLVEGSGAGWTFLRAGGFAANTLEWASQIRRGDVIRIPFPAAARSLVRERDIADVAVRVLLDGGPAGHAFTLTGPDVLTQADQAHAIGEAIGRPLRTEELPPDVARRELEATMGTEFAERSMAYWSTLVDSPERVTDDVERVTGRPARSFAEWAHDHVDDFTVPSTGAVARA